MVWRGWSMDNVSPTFKGLRILLEIVSGLTPMANFYWRIFQTFSNLWTSAFLRMLFVQFHSCLRTCCLDRSLAIWLRRTRCEGERCAADRTRAFSISPPDLIWIFLTVNPKLSPWTRLGNDRFKHSARHRLGGALDTWITWIPEMLEYQWPSFWVSTFINIGYKKGWFPIWHGETSVVFSMVFSMVFSVLEKWPKSDGSNDPAISSNPNFDEAFRPWSHC